MNAGAETEVDPPVDGDSSAAESGSNEVSGGRSDPSPLNQGEILRTLATVEKDSKAIAESFSSLFASLRSTLSEVTIKNQFLANEGSLMVVIGYRKLS
ncbi:hypothetical protein F2Q70_00032956 [Brassica cretica]|uniref:Uncharacterized protein n=1 Tax=Brassica cretica TaxID=69181 RepID=A0A8S9FE49_BRACR|nr:hypothetical protein F2Q70_00032956 [Brassica cretica]